MRRAARTIALAVILAIGAGMITYAHGGHGPAPASPTVSFAGQQSPLVRFELFRGNRIFLPVMVAGHPTTALLDSGAGMTVVDRGFAAQLGLTGDQAVMVGSAGGPVQGQFASGVAIKLGNMSLTGTTVLILDLTPIARKIGRSINVILGKDVFAAAVVDLDFDQLLLTLASPTNFTPRTVAERLPLTTTDGGIREMPIAIAGHSPLMAHFDLGNGSSLIVSRAYWEQENFLTGLRSAEIQGGGVGGAVPMRLAILPNVRVGSTTFHNVPASFNQNRDDLPKTGANIGIDLLSRFRLTIDYAHDAVYLQATRRTAMPLPRDRSGMRTELAENRLRVAYVSPDGPAAAAGWKIGDEIVAVDGLKVDQGYYASPANGWEKRAAGTRINLRRADGIDLPVTLHDYF